MGEQKKSVISRQSFGVQSQLQEQKSFGCQQSFQEPVEEPIQQERISDEDFDNILKYGDASMKDKKGSQISFFSSKHEKLSEAAHSTMTAASALSASLLKAAINKNIDENVTAKLVEAAMSATLLEAAMSATMIGIDIDAKNSEKNLDNKESPSNFIGLRTSKISDDLDEDLPEADQNKDTKSQGGYDDAAQLIKSAVLNQNMKQIKKEQDDDHVTEIDDKTPSVMTKMSKVADSVLGSKLSIARESE